MPRTSQRRAVAVGLLLAIFGALSACGAGGLGLAATTPSSGTPTATSIPTATGVAVAPCFPPGTPVPSGAWQLSQGNIPLPDNATVSMQGFGATGSGNGHGAYSFEVYGVCTPASTPDQIRAFYVANMPAQGWAQSATVPYQGDANAACGDAYCWKRDAGNNITEYLALENVQASGATTLYSLRQLSYNN